MWRVLGVMCCLFCGAALAQQYDENNLRGLERVYMSVNVDEEGRSCGLSQEYIRNAVLLPLNTYTKMEFVDSSVAGTILDTAPWLSFSVNTLKGSTGCFFHLELELSTTVSVIVSEQVGMRAQKVVLWRQAGLATTSLNGAWNLAKYIEEIVKKFAVAWQRANRK